MISLFSLISIGASLLGLTFIVSFHEFGHLIFAKLFKVYAPTFSIGIGPKVFSKKIGDTEYCISAAPLGGYVEIGEPEAGDPNKNYIGFSHIAYWKKVLIILGGIGCNIFLSYILFSLLFFIGLPQNSSIPARFLTNTVHTVTNESLTGQIPQNAHISMIGQYPVSNGKDIFEAFSKINPEENVKITYIHNETTQEYFIDLSSTKNLPIESKLGLNLSRVHSSSIIQNISWGIELTNLYMYLIGQHITSIFTQGNITSFVGPIMAISMSSKSAQKGISSFLFFLGVISINLGLMNLLPLPIFDGGQFVIFTTETIIRRQLSDKVKEIIGLSSWLLVIGLFILFSIKDIWHLICN
ncbi:RIP metalloprotease [bacterium]|nr:RIP metalloprotease [bacterium]NBX78241.1 RIP metalloprotease [bacterium]